MKAKLFDPFSEDALDAWLAVSPAKQIYTAQVYELAAHGVVRQVALVFYNEERLEGALSTPLHAGLSERGGSPARAEFQSQVIEALADRLATDAESASASTGDGRPSIPGSQCRS